MKIAFQMEPIDQPAPGDSHTLTLMHEATVRGYDVFHYTPDTVSLDNSGVVCALCATVLVNLGTKPHFDLGEYERHDLSSFDVIMFRQDPPYDIAYVTNTVLLERLRDDVLFVNDPFWIRNMPDKLSIFDFAYYLPPTLVSRNLDEIEAFYAAHKDIIIKPLHGFHGHGITRSQSVEDAKEKLKEYPEPLMFQPFLKEVLEGNKRVVFFDGEIVGVLNSVPANEEEFRIFRGSKDIAAELSARERKISEEVGAVLKQRGMMFVGIDFIGEYLTEINAGSVGSIFRLDEVYSDNYSAKLYDLIELKLSPKNR